MFRLRVEAAEETKKESLKAALQEPKKEARGGGLRGLVATLVEEVAALPLHLV